MTLIEESIAEYLMQLDRMDRMETPRNPRKAARLQERVLYTVYTRRSSRGTGR